MRSRRRIAAVVAVTVLAAVTAAVALASGGDPSRPEGGPFVLQASEPGGVRYRARFEVRGRSVCARLTVRGPNGTSGSDRCASRGVRGLSGIQHALCQDGATAVYGSAPTRDAELTVTPRGTVRSRTIGGRTAFLVVVGGAANGAEVRSSRGSAGHRRVIVDPLAEACAAQAGVANPTDTFEPFD